MLSVSLTSDSVLQTLSEKVWTIVRDNFLMNALTDAEVSDTDYFDWLREEGYTNEDGDIDWDRAPPYIEYNDDWKTILDKAEEWIHLRPGEMRGVVKLLNTDYSEDAPTDGWDFLLNWDYVLDKWVNLESKYLSYNTFYYMRKWIRKHIIITDDGKKVSVEYYAG